MKPTASITGLLTGLFVSALLIVMSVSPAAAQTSISGNIKGTFNAIAAGPCPTTASSDYANQCSGGGNGTPCGNVTAVPTPKITGNFGTGTITSMCITIDPGNNVNEPLDFNTKETCTPIYGDLTAATVRKGVATNTFVNFAGVFCHHQSNSTTGTIEAGFGIDGQDTDMAATGWGTLTGTLNKDTNAFSFKIKGSLTP